nr:MAG TPA: hypothetical protein [Caudoviricetes sp.]
MEVYYMETVGMRINCKFATNYLEIIAKLRL